MTDLCNLFIETCQFFENAFLEMTVVNKTYINVQLMLGYVGL